MQGHGPPAFVRDNPTMRGRRPPCTATFPPMSRHSPPCVAVVRHVRAMIHLARPCPLNAWPRSSLHGHEPHPLHGHVLPTHARGPLCMGLILLAWPWRPHNAWPWAPCMAAASPTHSWPRSPHVSLQRPPIYGHRIPPMHACGVPIHGPGVPPCVAVMSPPCMATVPPCRTTVATVVHAWL